MKRVKHWKENVCLYTNLQFKSKTVKALVGNVNNTNMYKFVDRFLAR